METLIVDYQMVFTAFLHALKLPIVIYIPSNVLKVMLTKINETICPNCIPDAKRGYYGFIIVVVRVRVRVRALVRVRVRRDFLLATYSPHFFPDFFHIWQVT